MSVSPSPIPSAMNAAMLRNGAPSAISTGDTRSKLMNPLLNLANSRVISTYRKRYDDFPTPVVDMGAGRCLLWLRADIEAWKARRS